MLIVTGPWVKHCGDLIDITYHKCLYGILSDFNATVPRQFVLHDKKYDHVSDYHLRSDLLKVSAVWRCYMTLTYLWVLYRLCWKYQHYEEHMDVIWHPDEIITLEWYQSALA